MASAKELELNERSAYDVYPMFDMATWSPDEGELNLLRRLVNAATPDNLKIHLK